MATKRVTTILIALMIAVLAVYSGSEAADENTMAPAVYMNDLPGPLSVKKPDPVHIMTFILAGQWVDKPFELYIFTGEGSGTYLGSDLAWNAYDSQHPLQPLISSGMPDYQGLHLPSFANLLWTAFNDSSVLADGDTVLTVCIDINMDGSLNAAESACGTMTIHVEKPACVLSLSPKVIPTKTITAGTNVQSETIAVSDSCNSSAFTVSVQSGGEWLSPQSVENTITLTYNSAGLSSRSEPYIGKILVTSSGGATDFITTSLTVLPKSTTCALAANPGQVNFTGSKSSIFPVVSVSNSPAAVAVTDCNGNVPGSLGVTIDTASKGWLSAARNALDGSLSVSVNGSGVGGTGTFRGTVTVTAAGASLNIPVTLVVSGSEPQTCSVSFPELSFGGAAGTVTSSQTVAVSDSCGNIKSFSSVAPSAGWISVNPTSGTGKFDVTVNSMPSVTTTGSISLRVDGVTYSFNVTAMPTGPACTTPTKVKLYDTSGGAISSLSVSGTTSGILSQTVGVRDDCSKAYTTYTFTYYEVASGAACTPPAAAAPVTPVWMSVVRSASDASRLNLSFTQATVGSYKACIEVKPDNTAFPAVTLPVQLTVTSAPQEGVTSLTSAVTRRMETLGPKKSKIYSADHKGTKAAFSLMTRDWATDCDMIVMYSGAACGQRVPDINDYNAIMADIARTGGYYQFGGKKFNDYDFYYGIGGQNEAVNMSGSPIGCYYMFIFNTDSSTTASYDVLFTDIQ